PVTARRRAMHSSLGTRVHLIVSVTIALLIVGALPAAARVAWTPTGSMAPTRTAHTATLLPDGRVLVAGGLKKSYSYLASAQIYDPATGAWTTTGSMATARSGHTATPPADRSVLVAGGENRAAPRRAETVGPGGT